MADRYATSAGYYERQQQAASGLPHNSFAAAQPYRSYGGYSPAPGYGYAHYGQAPSAYMHGYYGAQFESNAYRRYASYASPHYSQQMPPAHSAHQSPGLFTPAGQQLIPSSVLHYPPRQPPYQPSQPSSHASYASAAEQQLPHHSVSAYNASSHFAHAQARAAAAAAYQASAAAAAAAAAASSYSSTPMPYTSSGAPLPPQRSSTPAPNRTVLPPNFLEPLRNYAEQLNASSLRSKLDEPPDCGRSQDLESDIASSGASAAPAAAAGAGAGASPQRLTTSPPLISATGTDSGISNCSTRARSDSSQSTPVYSSEYPVNMSVESASCVSYHCPGDGKDYEEEQPRGADNAELEPLGCDINVKSETISTDDISAKATSTPTPPPLSSIDKQEAAEGKPTTSPTDEPVVADVVKQAEINLVKPKEEPDDAEQQGATTAACGAQNDSSNSSWCQQQQQHWSPAKRLPRTPPVPHNSPVGYGQSSSAAPQPPPPALAPLLQQSSSKAHGTRNALTAKGRSNRIIECDLIPSKKSKRKSAKTYSESNTESVESTVREQIRDIKPLPGFQQAFGSTEIGRFSETFLQTPENIVERIGTHFDEYGSTPYHNPYYDATPTPATYWAPYDECNNYNSQMSRNRLRSHGGYGFPDYMAYERYAAYSAGRGRYGEIRCNGY
ncbi:endochitinase A [Scaptodrosophila lebanonensis]|uniref:Endochitinase A n=1 Tax=Drosophila lebanonensis TaxID=7225 RepID=A0A6J2TBH0_DROLE|nr:endochitinase A [Scaptodrosophila lebanonensis]